MYKEGDYINDITFTQKKICKDCFYKAGSQEEYRKYLSTEDYIGDNFYCPECNQLIIGENHNPFNAKYINHIPLYLYVNILRERFYDTEYIIQYTKEIYDIDLTVKEINGYGYESVYLNLPDYNIFEEYRELKNININEDDCSRDHFNNKARNQYKDFLKYIEKKYIYYFDKGIPKYTSKCFGISLKRGSAIHHIHPLVYEGNNQLENLISINDWTHNLLHNNPLEKYKKYCFQALDYLNYLGNYNLFYLMDKHNVFERSNSIIDIAAKIISNAIEEEMYLYYHELKEKNKNSII